MNSSNISRERRSNREEVDTCVAYDAASASAFSPSPAAAAPASASAVLLSTRLAAAAATLAALHRPIFCRVHVCASIQELQAASHSLVLQAVQGGQAGRQTGRQAPSKRMPPPLRLGLSKPTDWLALNLS